jgi:hypothetical protein
MKTAIDFTKDVWPSKRSAAALEGHVEHYLIALKGLFLQCWIIEREERQPTTKRGF